MTATSSLLSSLPALAACALALSTICGCTPNDEGTTPTPGEPKALVIGIDGLRGDGIPGASTPRLDALVEASTWTLFASTQVEAATVSGPGWTSILTGVDADKHLSFSNGSWDEIDRSYPTMVARAHDLGLSTATAIHWLPIATDIIEPGVTDEAVVGDDEGVADGMAAILETSDHDLHFVHLDEIDGTGHSSGFSTDNPDYVAAVERADDQVGRMLDGIERRSSRDQESWLVIVTSDHGGEGTDHGPTTPDNREIPFIVGGDPVAVGQLNGVGQPPGELEVGFVSHMDAHPTVFQHLGFPPESSWGLDGFVRGLD